MFRLSPPLTLPRLGKEWGLILPIVLLVSLDYLRGTRGAQEHELSILGGSEWMRLMCLCPTIWAPLVFFLLRRICQPFLGKPQWSFVDEQDAKHAGKYISYFLLFLCVLAVAAYMYASWPSVPALASPRSVRPVKRLLFVTSTTGVLMHYLLWWRFSRYFAYGVAVEAAALCVFVCFSLSKIFSGVQQLPGGAVSLQEWCYIVHSVTMAILIPATILVIRRPRSPAASI